MRYVRRLPALLSVLLACGGLTSTQKPIRIFAAASLTDALSALITEFESAHPRLRVVPQFGGSSDLARQILAGAPADLFFSADALQLDRVAAEGRLEEGMRADVLSNELVVVRPRDAPATLSGPRELATLGRIAMADPQAVPAGVYARRYLEAAGLWPELRSKVVPTLDVRGALAAVASGNVEAGFVYRTDAAIEDRVRVVYALPRGEAADIVYPLGVVAGQARPEVRAFYDYLTSREAGELFARYGFVPLH